MRTLNETIRNNGVTFHKGNPSEFLTICDNILAKINSHREPILIRYSSHDEELQVNEASVNLNIFEREFLKCLREDGYSHVRKKSYFKTDAHGRKVEIKPNQRFYQGRNKKGIALSKGDRVVHDDHNQAYAVPKGAETYKNPDGTLSIRKKK